MCSVQMGDMKLHNVVETCSLKTFETISNPPLTKSGSIDLWLQSPRALIHEAISSTTKHNHYARFFPKFQAIEHGFHGDTGVD